jgi:DNA-binding PadR family transcriptional regulator
MEIVTLHELKDSYIELQKQRETRRKAMKKYRASTKGKAALARANKKYLDKQKQKQKTTKKTTKSTVAKKQ